MRCRTVCPLIVLLAFAVAMAAGCAASSTATDAQLEPLRHGIDLDDGPARPDKAVLRERGLVELTLTEGRNHQVKRMLALVKLPVKNLHREAVGALTLDIDIAQLRELTAAEIKERLGFVPRGG